MDSRRNPFTVGLIQLRCQDDPAANLETAVEHIRQAFTDFIPPANTVEREMQTLCAVLESTSRELVPTRFREMDRAAVMARTWCSASVVRVVNAAPQMPHTLY